MAFSSFGNPGNAMLGSAAGAGGLNTGPDLETIQTEALGFLSIAGDAKLRLTSSWPSLPASSASLLSIASRRGLVAAAGPDQVILATTESVRKAFEAPKNGDSDVRDFEPQLKIAMPMRVSQLYFTADENYLVLSAESGGGLAVYEVQSLLQNSTSSAFELSTNGETLRALIPNPTPEKAELCAIITNNGNLHMANLKERQISNPLKTQVSCVSWSSKGKQLCAGLADGTATQMTPEGEAKGEIPQPPNMGDCHVSALTWLENNLWLSIHTTNTESPPTSTYHIITRQPPSSFTFQKLTDPVEPFGSDKTPHHSILRLRDFKPALQDLLIVCSTAVSEIGGVLSRSTAPLATDRPAEAITGVFTTTEFLDDTKRPTLPMTDSMEDSTPVGTALDLSGKDKVYKPIPSDVELEESPGPLPGFWILTHEGVLCSWWVVYNDSIKQGLTYEGLSVTKDSGTVSAPAPAPAVVAASPFASTGASTFGSPANASTAFGASSQLGQKSSPWGSAGASAAAPSTGGAVFGSTTFGSPGSAAPAFGKPSAIGFGQSSQMGANSPWGASAGTGTTSTFGQTGFASFANNDSNKSAFGSAAAASPSAAPSGGFAGFASQGGFASVASNNNNSGSVFGSANQSSSPFGSGSNADTAFPAQQDKPSGSSVFGSTPFKLQSSFKPDPSAKEDNKPPPLSGSSMFGNGFSVALTDASDKPLVSTPTTATRDEVMDATEETPQAKPKASSLFPAARSSPESTTPTTTPAPSKFGYSTTPATVTATSIFGQPSNFSASSGGGLFGGSKPDTPKTGGLFGSQQATPKAGGGLFGQTPKQSTYTGIFGQKSEMPKPEKKQGFDVTQIKQEDDAPLPPDSTSRAAFPIGDSSSSSATSTAPSQPFGATTALSSVESAPLPPDFVTAPKAAGSATADHSSSVFLKPRKPTEPPLPPDFVNVSKPATSKVIETAPLPPDFTKPSRSAAQDAPLPPDSVKSKALEAPLPSDFVVPEARSGRPPAVPSVPDSTDDDSELDDDEDDGSEGSGIDVAKDLSPSTSGLAPTPGFTPQSSFGGIGGITPASIRPGQDASRPLFGELSRNAPLFPRPTATSPRSPSPVRGAVPNRVIRTDATRSVSAPGMASQLLGPRRSQYGASILGREPEAPADDPFMVQHRKMKARQEAEETQPLVDEEDDEVQRILSSEVEGTLSLDEFIAHSNVAPPAKESVPGQVEAVYRDINSMIDTLGLNSRTVKSFIKGNTENCKDGGRNKDDLEISDDWVLCEIDDLGEVLDDELYPDLEDGRVRDLEDKLDACQELSREMHRLRAKQEDLKQIIMAKADPEQAEATRSLPLSAEQATQQNELRRDFARFSKLLAEAEEALTLLKTKIVSVSSASGKGKAHVPTVDAVVRTITKMTSMVEKRSGDVDMLENQLRKVHISTTSRDGSPMTPQGRKSVMFSPESTPVRNLRHSFAGSISLGASMRATPPRKKLSGFSLEEKGDLMEKRTRRQAVLQRLKGSVEKSGVNVWTMEDIE